MTCPYLKKTNIITISSIHEQLDQYQVKFFRDIFKNYMLKSVLELTQLDHISLGQDGVRLRDQRRVVADHIVHRHAGGESNT